MNNLFFWNSVSMFSVLLISTILSCICLLLTGVMNKFKIEKCPLCGRIKIVKEKIDESK